MADKTIKEALLKGERVTLECKTDKRIASPIQDGRIRA